MFDGPKLKVERAKCHISDLDAKIRDFLARDPYPVVIQDDPKTGDRLIKPIIREPTPECFCLIVGDAIHNLRAALDHLACDLVRNNGGSTSNVYFPFAKDRDSLEAQIKEKMKGASTDVLDIIRSLKPYKGADGNVALRALHDLDIADKHIALVPMASIASMRNIQILNSRSSFFIGGITIFPEKGAAFFSFPANRKIEINGNLDTSFQITLGEGQPLEREPIIPTLHQLANIVDGIIQTFEAHFHP